MSIRSIAMTMVVCAALVVPARGVQAQGSATAAKPATQKPTATTQKPAGTGAKPGTSTAKPAAAPLALRTPAKLKEKAPETFKVNFDTSAGVFVVEVTRAWAPLGADRFYNLAKYGFFDGDRFFRVVPNFVVQFGLYGDPKVGALWRDANIPDDPVTQSNKRGTLVFATAGPNTRTTQLFINFRDNARLDASGFAPFGVVTSGMDVVDKINPEYGEQPNQGMIQTHGNAYLIKEFPRLDYIKKATIVQPAGAKPAAAKPAGTKPTTAKPAATKPATTKPTPPKH
jgi:peptidyl-prolyl cis-trans isomerase A (cyclophilin A)